MKGVDKELLQFKRRFSPDVLKNISGLALLKLLAYPKNLDQNIKIQFKDLYEDTYNSLKNELEKGMVDFGSGNAGSDTNFPLAYRGGDWHNYKNTISLQEAIRQAENIKQELIEASNYLENNDFYGFYHYVANSTTKLFKKGYTHKYFYILYPQFISFYHSSTWQQYYKECLKLPSTDNYYDIEKYFIEKYPNCHVGVKSRELEKRFDIPRKVQYWLRSANSNIYNHKGAFDKFGFIDWRQHNKFNVNDIVYIYSSASDKRIRYKTIVEKIDIPFEQINDDAEFWKNIEEYEKNKKGKYVRLKLLKEVDHTSLMYENLKKFNYINNAPQGSIKITDKNFINFLNNYFGDNYMLENKPPDNNKTSIPLNQILYGPPGTGKTYNTVLKAMSIIDDIEYENVSDEKYSELKKEFDKLKKEERIDFVTFHQSYSYEEFIEGIKPEIFNWDSAADALNYVGKDGIFKQICNRAERDLYKIAKNEEIDFDKAYELFKEKYESGSDFSNLKNIQYEGDNLVYHFGNQTGDRRIDLNKIRDIYNSNKRYTTAVEFNKDYKGNNPLKGYFFNFYKELITIKDDYEKEIRDNNINQNANKYILIIDEINRGNISKIFGELITLIEPDKRLGADYELKVSLPYSKDSFGVPKNLYIIGTMNTSDRSIASIDIALRRRFKFIEMMPKKELVADFGINFADIFESLNAKIKILLDRDHQIGHSYFVKTKYENAGINELKAIWFSEILPLLNEYFYCDWEKLKLIIPGFIKKVDIPTTLKSDCDEDIYEYKSFGEVDDFVSVLKSEKFEG